MYLLTSQSCYLLLYPLLFLLLYPLLFSPPNSYMPKPDVLLATEPSNYEHCTYRMLSFLVSHCTFRLYVNKATRTEPLISAHLRHLPAPAEARPNWVCAASRQQTATQFEQQTQANQLPSLNNKIWHCLRSVLMLLSLTVWLSTSRCTQFPLVHRCSVVP